MSTSDFRDFIFAHYNRDKSAAEIARAISAAAGRHITRNAVIGFAQRNGLSFSRARGATALVAITPPHLISLAGGRYNTITRHYERDGQR